MTITSDEFGPGTEIDPDVLSRWMVVSSLIVGAEELQLRGSGAWPRMALVMADTASEAMLGLLASGAVRAPGDSARWEDVLTAAMEATTDTGGIPASLISRLRQTHRARNLAIHHGTDSGVETAKRAITASKDLRVLATSRSPLLTAFAQAGPIAAVAQLVDREPLTDPLMAAATCLAANDITGAADAAAAALDRVLRLVDPPLRVDHRPYNWDLQQRFGYGRDPVEEALRKLRSGVEQEVKESDRRARLQEAWVVALGIGLSPRQLAGLTRTLGSRVQWTRDAESRRLTWSVRRRDGESLDPRVVEAAVQTVADIIFRLWATDSLRKPDGRNVLE